MAGQRRIPWDQRPGEPDAAYRRFQAYLNLGFGRTLRDAAGVATDGNKRQQVPGTWGRDSTTYSWADRAHAWDLEQFRGRGFRAVQHFMVMIERVSSKLAGWADRVPEPKTWAEFLEVIQTWRALIPNETVAALLRYQPEFEDDEEKGTQPEWTGNN